MLVTDQCDAESRLFLTLPSLLISKHSVYVLNDEQYYPILISLMLSGSFPPVFPHLLKMHMKLAVAILGIFISLFSQYQES